MINVQFTDSYTIDSYTTASFHIKEIEDIFIQELSPNGYIKTIISKYGDTIVSYYNKDQLLIKQDISNVSNAKLFSFTSDTKPKLFDTLFSTWYQHKILSLKEQVVDLINQKEVHLKIIQQQADVIKPTLPRENTQ